MKANEKKKPSCFQWIQLIISFSVPATIAIYTILESNRELSIAARHRAQDLEIADNQQKDLILRDYETMISKLIQRYGPQLNRSTSTSLVVRFATISTFSQLNSNRRNFVLRLLYDTKLITYHSISDPTPISLDLVNLTDICLIDGSIGQTLTRISLEGAIMTNANFRGINFEGARFSRASLNYSDFSNTTNMCVTDDHQCSESFSSTVYFEEVELMYGSFTGSIYHNVTFSSSTMRNANLQFFECSSCDFFLAEMIQVDLKNVIINRSSFAFTILTRANLNQSIFGRNIEFYATNLREVNAIHTHFIQCQFEYTSITNAIFEYTTFEDSTFQRANLSETSMRHSVFINVKFFDTQLIAANWQNVRCEKCIFNNVDFTLNDLSNSIFIDSDFRNSTISEDQLNQIASLKGSILPNETVIH
jgi:uncharacterized protein YjbI with pentapeptide repeats